MPENLAIASALAKVCLGYTQCLGAIIRFPLISWPAAFTRFIEALDLLNLELFAIVPAEVRCHLPSPPLLLQPLL